MKTERDSGLSGPSLRRQLGFAVRALWPHRLAVAVGLLLHMASVAVESVAVVSLARLFTLLLDMDSTALNENAVVGLPNRILSTLGVPVTATSVFVLILSLLVFKTLLRVVAVFIQSYVTSTFYKRHIDRLASSYLHADWRHLSGRRAGELLDVMLVEVPKSTTMIRAVLGMAANTLSSVVYLTFALLVSPVAVGLLMASLGILLLLLWPLLRTIRRLAAELIPVYAAFAQRLEEIISGAKIMKALGAEERVHADISRDTARWRRLTMRIGPLSETSSAAELAIVTSLLIVFLLHATGLTQAIDAGLIGVILLRVSQRVQGAISTSGQIAMGLPSVAVTLGTMEELDRHREKDGRKAVDSFGALRFERVSYGYDPGREVLSDIDVTIAKGEFLGIVGDSGAGKTTLVDLLLGLLNPTAGVIMIDGSRLEDVQRVTWRRRLGYVPQETVLSNDTVFNNIAAYREGVSADDVRWAAEIAQATGFIDQLELGYESIVGDRGVKLSGGQRQRLALARALAARPDILLLDEATSSLDSHAEREFQDALENARGQLTIVAVAHRLSTVIRADRVIVLDGGQIVESGPPLELLEIPNGHFQRLYTLQAEQPTRGSSPVEEPAKLPTTRRVAGGSDPGDDRTRDA